MQKDIEKTEVIFLLEKGNGTPNQSVFAFFPKEHYHHEEHPNYKKTFTSYAHVGQHSACHIDYASKAKEASPEQYENLKIELEGLGYNLELMRRISPAKLIREMVIAHSKKPLKP